jgi:hypothetical protein
LAGEVEQGGDLLGRAVADHDGGIGAVAGCVVGELVDQRLPG